MRTKYNFNEALCQILDGYEVFYYNKPLSRFIQVKNQNDLFNISDSYDDFFSETITQ